MKRTRGFKPQQGVVVFAKNKKRVSAFYRETLSPPRPPGTSAVARCSTGGTPKATWSSSNSGLARERIVRSR